MAKVPVAADAYTKSYYKYYENVEIADLTPEQFAYIENCVGKEEDALLPQDRNKLLEPGVTYPAKTGVYPLKEGGFLVAGNVPMPDVTAEMLYWWFAWHGLESLRYTIWDPEDHYGVKIDEVGKSRALDPSIPMEEKTWGATHTVLESIGGPADDIVIMFKNPADMGFDPSKIGAEGCEFIVTANCLLGPMKIPSLMLEVAKKIDGVMTFTARFYMGYNIVDGVAKYLLPPGVQIPVEAALGLVGHSIKEFSHLNKILPQVYAEEKDNW